MIHYVTYTRGLRYAIKDVKAVREAELSTRLIVTDVRKQ